MLKELFSRLKSQKDRQIEILERDARELTTESVRYHERVTALETELHRVLTVLERQWCGVEEGRIFREAKRVLEDDEW